MAAEPRVYEAPYSVIVMLLGCQKYIQMRIVSFFPAMWSRHEPFKLLASPVRAGRVGNVGGANNGAPRAPRRRAPQPGALPLPAVRNLQYPSAQRR